MYKIPTLNAGASDLRLSGDQTQRGTYTQRRRGIMAAAQGGRAGFPSGPTRTVVPAYLGGRGFIEFQGSTRVASQGGRIGFGRRTI